MKNQIIPGRFEGRSAIVTGGAQGIGEAIVTRLAREGASVIIADIQPEVGEATAAKLQADGLKVFFEQVNVADDDSVARMVGSAVTRLGGVDILVNNAGITGNEKTFMKMNDLAEHRKIMAVNLFGPMACSHAVLPHMIENKYGRIVNASSVVATKGNFGQTGYGAAKAALLGFTFSLAKEVAKHGITVNAVAPGFTDTKMLSVVPQENLAKLAAMTPVGRLGTAEELAAAYVYLASEEAGFTTGTVLAVDGGLPL